MLRTATLLATGLALSTATGCASRPAAAAAPVAAPVTVATAQAPGTQAIYRGPGTVAAGHTYAVGFEIAGRIARVNVDVGDRVRAGTVLAAIDPSDYAAQDRAAQARAAASAAAARKAHAGARPQERTQATDAVRAARAQLDRALAAQRLAVQNLDRYAALVHDGDVSQQQYDSANAAARDATGAVNAARAALAQAQAQNALVAIGTRSEDVAAADAQAAADAAGADLAAITLRKAAITAPADVEVLARNVEPGNEAQPGVPAFTLVDAHDRDVRIAVPEAHLAGIHVGTPATVTIDGKEERGTVSRIEPAADATTRTAQVRIVIANLSARPGEIVDVALGERPLAGSARIPLASVVTEPDGTTHVVVIDARSKTARVCSVHVRDIDGDFALVTGVAPGTQIVRAGAHLVAAGAPVRIVSAP